MATAVKRSKKATVAKRAPRKRLTPEPEPLRDSMVVSLARQLQSWTGAVLTGAGTAGEVVMAVAKGRVQKPGPKAAVEKAAGLLRDLREAAGLTVEDVGRLLELEDISFMSLVESGAAGLPFDLILRLATVLSRNDPVGFILQMTRTYNPKMWKALDALGIGKLLVQAGREREFANIYRRHSAARELSDQDFAAALGFAEAAFASALDFQARHRKN